ncbi:MAG: hypothetical protein IJH07_10805 [Ruminococcus sp.]|nr:hypothetical protein [Ruminococcus sp.]
MKRIMLLICAVIILGLSLCSCMNTSAQNVDETAVETRMNSAQTERSRNDNGVLGDKRETVMPTEKNNMAETVMDAVETRWDEMVQDGEIEDGDGNVGELENNDGDGNVDPDAVD